MIASGIRISVVLATKDRYETLFDCVRGLLINYARDDVEIIVRDNSTAPRAAEFLAEFAAFPGVRYVPDPEPVSQSENYERALDCALGEFVTMIGDDDGIAVGMLELAAWMNQHHIDALFPGFSVYLWPGVNSRFAAANDHGMLAYKPTAEPLRRVDAEHQRQRVLASGCTSLELLPRLYYGLVRRQALLQARTRAGSFFPGPSPDMANAYALSYVTPRFFVGALPLFIAGNSRQSNAGLGLRGQHIGEIDALPFLPRNTSAQWHAGIPYFWSGQTIWCQSACTAARAMGHEEEFENQNDFRLLYAKLLVFQPHLYRRTLQALQHQNARSRGPQRLLNGAAVLVLALAVGVRRVWSFAGRRLGLLHGEDDGRLQVLNLPTVSSATRAVDTLMRELQLVQWLERTSAQPVSETAA